MNYFRVVMVMCPLLALHSQTTAAGDSYDERRVTGERIGAAELQTVAENLRVRLDILERVEVVLVAHNPLVLSVETRSGRSGPFVISVDEEFVASLTSREQEAALAHELGHVWIHTHHPYLQTEKLANDIALRVVSRSILQPLYEKVWKRTGIKGNLTEFIGQP